MAGPYDKGDTIRVTCTFKNSAGVDTDPTAVVARVQDPAGVETTPTVTKSATGIYYIDVTPSLSGTYYYRFEGTGALVAASPDGHFNVKASEF